MSGVTGIIESDDESSSEIQQNIKPQPQQKQESNNLNTVAKTSDTPRVFRVSLGFFFFLAKD